MDKQEVKREYKEQEGNQKLSLNAESASGNSFWAIEVDVSNSRLMISNPTHIAIGISLSHIFHLFHWFL